VTSREAQSGPDRQNGDVTALSWTAIGTPAGRLSVGCSDAGLAAVRFGDPPRPSPAPSPGGPGDARETRHQVLIDTCVQLSEYFAGQRRGFDVPIDWSGVSRPQYQVLSVLFDSVGYGDTITYGALARRAGVADEDSDGAAVLPARAVGRIMGSNPVPVIVPCHRVVAGNGLGGFSGGIGPELKRWLLIFEGALPPTLDWTPAGLPE
jgi:methylated-DNA-[protein]-cysteine S-methyltransferase